jgi:DNA-binding MarR family transcriptional regulator
MTFQTILGPAYGLGMHTTDGNGMTRTTAEKPLSDLLLAVARQHRSRSSALLAAEGLFAGQDTLILALAEAGPTEIGALAAQLGVRAPTVSKAINRLAENGMLERAPVDGDRRRVAVALTALGAGKVDRIAEIRDRVEAELLSALDDKDCKRLRKLLRRAGKGLRKAAGLEGPQADPAGIDGDD